MTRHPWLRLRYNSISLAIECSIKGHQWRDESVGVIGIEVLVCRNCGHYQGHRRTRDELFISEFESVRPGYGIVHWERLGPMVNVPLD